MENTAYTAKAKMKQAFALHIVKSVIGTAAAFLFFTGLYYLMKKVASELQLRGAFENQAEVQQVLQMISEAEVVPAGLTKWVQLLPALILVEACVIHLFAYYLHKIDMFFALSEYDQWSIINAMFETTGAFLGSAIIIMCYIAWLQDDVNNFGKKYPREVNTQDDTTSFQSYVLLDFEKMISMKHVMLIRGLYTALIPLLYWVYSIHQNR